MNKLLDSYILKRVLNNIIFRKILFILALILLWTYSQSIIMRNVWMLSLFLALIPIIGRCNKRKIIASFLIYLFIINIPWILIIKLVVVPYKLYSNSFFMNITYLYFNFAIGLLIFFPSAFEVMRFKKAFKAIIVDILIFTLLSMFYTTFAISIVYIGVRLWGILFGVYSYAPKVWRAGSSVGRAIVLAGITIYMLINLNSDFLFVSSDYFYSGKPWSDRFASSIMSLALNVIIGGIMFILTLISLYRFTKYLRLAMPHAMQSMLDVLYCFPGVIGFVGLIFFKLFAIFGGDFSGGEGFEGDFAGEEGFEGDFSGEGVSIANEGVAEASNINRLGFEIGPLQEVSAYVKSDGTFVNSYLRNIPDGIVENNIYP